MCGRSLWNCGGMGGFFGVEVSFCGRGGWEGEARWGWFGLFLFGFGVLLIWAEDLVEGGGEGA